MSCRFDRKPGNSYIYVEFPGFRPERNQEGCEKDAFSGSHLAEMLLFFLQKSSRISWAKIPYSASQWSESTLSQFCEQTAMVSAGRCGGRSERPKPWRSGFALVVGYSPGCVGLWLPGHRVFHGQGQQAALGAKDSPE